MKKKPLKGLFRDNPTTPEGKYLVKRRDGTVPPWPSFVLGGADPHAAVALRAYAQSINEARLRGETQFTEEFVKALFRWCDEFDNWRKQHGEGDPGMGAHRIDDPTVIAEMKKGMSA
jgi:hypothetical protein